MSYLETVNSNPEGTFPIELIEHLDMAFHIDSNVIPMETPEINTRLVELKVKCMKNRSAPGPDGLKPEMYKALVKTPEGFQTLTRCM